VAERNLIKKFSQKKQNLHKKFIARLLRLDFPRQAYLTRLLYLIYFIKRNPKHTGWGPSASSFGGGSRVQGVIETILDDLHAEIGGLCAYQSYVPEIIERQNDNFLLYEFLNLSTSSAQIIISITEYFVKIYSEEGVKKTVWEPIIFELEEVEQNLLRRA